MIGFGIGAVVMLLAAIAFGALAKLHDLEKRSRYYQGYKGED